LQIQYSAIQKVLAQEVFTAEGRRYVQGIPAAKCSFAYLAHPEPRGEDGRLTLKARFTGRSALDLFGRCIGLGDSFDVDHGPALLPPERHWTPGCAGRKSRPQRILRTPGLRGAGG
jgi:hypothetical protein